MFTRDGTFGVACVAEWRSHTPQPLTPCGCAAAASGCAATAAHTSLAVAQHTPLALPTQHGGTVPAQAHTSPSLQGRGIGIPNQLTT